MYALNSQDDEELFDNVENRFDSYRKYQYSGSDPPESFQSSDADMGFGCCDGFDRSLLKAAETLYLENVTLPEALPHSASTDMDKHTLSSPPRLQRLIAQSRRLARYSARRSEAETLMQPQLKAGRKSPRLQRKFSLLQKPTSPICSSQNMMEEDSVLYDTLSFQPKMSADDFGLVCGLAPPHRVFLSSSAFDGFDLNTMRSVSIQSTQTIPPPPPSVGLCSEAPTPPVVADPPPSPPLPKIKLATSGIKVKEAFLPPLLSNTLIVLFLRVLLLLEPLLFSLLWILLLLVRLPKETLYALRH
ncbi:hypothetical protein PGIGA_G00214040 [Pangasianodon gigas]|uniref:Uncharacterized protein n=1 Tax=Pangasianodon gigas TaxID=30993 RepID=A0ACC5WHZ0_PANGG|nr:hypothetical protein [Pangasianodon gigas]